MFRFSPTQISLAPFFAFQSSYFLKKSKVRGPKQANCCVEQKHREVQILDFWISNKSFVERADFEFAHWVMRRSFEPLCSASEPKFSFHRCTQKCLDHHAPFQRDTCERCLCKKKQAALSLNPVLGSRSQTIELLGAFSSSRSPSNPHVVSSCETPLKCLHLQNTEL